MAKRATFRFNTRELGEGIMRELQMMPDRTKKAMDGVGGDRQSLPFCQKKCCENVVMARMAVYIRKRRLIAT